ncbi:hypothetical protein UFOVP32_20 [uncultured Caudovirales phage]|uniref:Major tropism determinant N-terminal domain-containing protein n=1 Tax=uncultured Caudovirales phage TaxID=2100421 RepID=A0A6J5KQC1_9CAUD|nr:hypothetical protein UFOVP32_20 [uncultured Caudovirales phage]CAB4123756.1 hypothetical protein UFOVP50_56 [uncultured Caudovirales phage]
MSQTYSQIPATDTIQNSRQKILDRDDAAASNFSGTSFPSSNLLVGMRCHRTDLNKAYVLKDTTPTWVEVEDISGTSGVAPRATQLATARTIAVSGDAGGSAAFDGSANISITLALGNVGTAGTYTKVTTDAKGRVTGGASLASSDIPTVLDAVARQTVANNGTVIGSRRKLNLIPGAGVSISASDDPNNEKLDVTIAASGTTSGAVTTALGYTPMSMNVDTWNASSEGVQRIKFANSGATFIKSNGVTTIVNGSGTDIAYFAVNGDFYSALNGWMSTYVKASGTGLTKNGQTLGMTEIYTAGFDFDATKIVTVDKTGRVTAIANCTSFASPPTTCACND